MKIIFQNNRILSLPISYPCAVTILLLLTASWLQAELPPQAQEAMQKGLQAARRQQWEIAIQSFQEARKTAPNAPELFYNLGLAESKVPGRELRAIAWFGAYLAANPNAPNAAAVKDQIQVFDAKSKSNLSRLIKSVQDMAIQIHNLNPSNNVIMGDPIWCWANTGDYAAAKDIANLIQDRYWKSDQLSTIALFQAKAGDIAGAKKTLAFALKTADQIQDAGQKNLALDGIAETQAIAGDISGALKTADRIQNASYRSSVLSVIATNQVKAGDIAAAKKTLASALKTVDLVQDANSKSAELALIAEAQAKAGDIVGAQETADSIQNASWKSQARKAIAEAQLQPAVSVNKVSDWLYILDNDDRTVWADSPLNTDPFRDLAGYLKSLPSSDDPQKVYAPFSGIVQKIVKAQGTIDKMLMQQAKQ